MSKNNDIQEGILDAFRGKSDADKKATNIDEAIKSMKASYTASCNLLITKYEKILAKLQQEPQTEAVQNFTKKITDIKDGLEKIRTYVKSPNAFREDIVPQDILNWSTKMLQTGDESYDKDIFKDLTDPKAWNLTNEPDKFKERSDKLRSPFYLTFMYATRQIKTGGEKGAQVDSDKLNDAITALGFSQGQGIDSALVMKAFAASGPNIMSFIKDPLHAIKMYRSTQNPNRHLKYLAKTIFKKKEMDKINKVLNSIKKYVDLDGTTAETKKLIDDIVSEEIMGNTSYTLQWNKYDPPLQGKNEVKIENGEAKFTKTLDKYVDILKRIFDNDPNDNILRNIGRNAMRVANTYGALKNRVNQYTQWTNLPRQNRPRSPGQAFTDDPGLLTFIRNNLKNLRKYLKIAETVLNQETTGKLLFKLIQLADDQTVDALEENKRKTIKKLIHLIEQEIKNSNKQKLVNSADHEVKFYTIRK